MTAAPRAGWYPDPGERPETFRWWDGTEWTDHLSERAQAPDPTASRAGATAPTGARSAYVSASPTTGRPASTHRRSTARRLLALVVVTALVATAGAGVGLWLWRDPGPGGDQPARGGLPAPSSSSSATAPSGQLDQRTRTATIAGVSMVLPDHPYDVGDDPVAVPHVLDAAFMAEAVVHADYDGRADWSALVALVWVDPALVRGGLEGGASTAVHQLADVLYGQHATTVSDVRTDAQAVDGYSGMVVTAEVHYEITGLASRHDLVAAHLVRLDAGTVVAGLISVPDDADPQVMAQARASLATLTVS